MILTSLSARVNLAVLLLATGQTAATRRHIATALALDGNSRVQYYYAAALAQDRESARSPPVMAMLAQGEVDNKYTALAQTFLQQEALP